MTITALKKKDKKKKSKKNKAKRELIDPASQAAAQEHVVKVKKKKKTKNEPIKNASSELQANLSEGQGQKKKKSKHKVEDKEAGTRVEDLLKEVSEPQASRKRKKSKKGSTEVLEGEEDQPISKKEKKNPKELNCKDTESETVDPDPKLKKKKKKERQKAKARLTRQVETLIGTLNGLEVEEKSSASFTDSVRDKQEVTVDADHKAKKKEKKDKHRGSAAIAIDKDRSDTTDSTSKSVISAPVGQWATADLGDSDRQKKFYQLLGGMKSSNPDSTKSSGASKPFLAKFNAALNKKQETELNSKLERQFDRAMYTSLGARGQGLGFASRNSIDTSSRSQKFDDD